MKNISHLLVGYKPGRFFLMSILFAAKLKVRFKSFVRAGLKSLLIGMSVCAVQIVWLCPHCSAEIPLPTPRSHYEKFKPGLSGLPLFATIYEELDPAARQLLIKLAVTTGFFKDPSLLAANPSDLMRVFDMEAMSEMPQAPPASNQQAIALLMKTDWSPVRLQLLEFIIHQSQVLDMIPQKWGSAWYPIVHDALLYFLDHLPEDRFHEKLVNLVNLRPESQRGQYLSAFVSKIPSLQKIGQILARNPDLAPDYREALQRLENSIQTTSRDELVQFIAKDVGEASILKYQIEFADEILAEASVGAVIRATCVPPGRSRQDAVCKVIKPYVLTALPQDLSIIDDLAAFFTREHDFYQLGSTPLVEMFQDLKRALTSEIKILEEQHNLVRAREYYRDNKKILVPELFPISTGQVTFMEFVHGEKIAGAFPNDARQRAIMARRLSDALTFDVLFSPKQEALFHGDPHAGNVFHVTNNSKDPYQIALLDWGLCGVFPRQERIALVQLIVGVKLRDAKRLRNHIGALLEDGLPDSAEKLHRIDAIIAEVLKPRTRRSSFEAIEELLLALIQEGYATRFSLNLFVKSQVTIAGILAELDPTLKQDDYLEKRISGLVKRELPKRLLYTLWFPAWNSPGYRSLLSNEDIKDLIFNKPKE
jgi:ubiquinone biosynthesis protein